MTFQTMVNLQSPSNVEYFLSIFIKLLNIEVIDPQETFWYLDAVGIDFGEDEEYATYENRNETDEGYFLKSHVMEMGFETYNPVLNAGGIFVFIFATITSMVIVPLVFYVCKFTYKFCRFLDRMERHNARLTALGYEGGEKKKKEKSKKKKDRFTRCCDCFMYRTLNGPKRALLFNMPIGFI